MRVGIDIGGTSAKLGLVDDAGAVVARGQVPTGRDLEADALVERLARAVTELREGREALGLGVAAPGMRRADGEGVVNVTNLPHIDGYPLRDRLEAATGLRTTLDNDANAAALGEYRFGAGKGVPRLLVMTVGTGIGAGMVVDGEVHRVAWQGLGDPGHVIVQAGGPECGCGGHGCVEGLASVPAILRRASVGGVEPATLAGVTEAARLGEPAATEALAEAGHWLGVALATLTHVLAPERILLGGGGLDATEELLLAPIREALFAHVQPFLGARLTLGRAALGNDAGLIGAAALVAAL
jgi:glucokinase